MVKKKQDSKESLFSVTLPDGSVLDYPAYFEATSLHEEPLRVRMLPLSVGVEEQAFLLIGKLMSAVPELEETLGALTSGAKTLRESLTIKDIIVLVRSACENAPSILIELAAVLCELDVDGVRKNLTLAEIVEMITPAVFLEKYRFTASLGNILERLGFDLDEEEAEPVEIAELDAGA